jgi:hypothetical protein
MKSYTQLAIGVVLASQAAIIQAEIKSVSGTASMYFPPNIPVVSNLPVTGHYDTATQSITIDPWMFFGMPVNSQIDVLPAGNYSYPGVTPFNVGPDQSGGFITTEWGVNTIPHAIVWDVSNHSGGQHLAATDSDNDGAIGHTMISGPFPGISFIYELDIGNPSPMIDVNLNVAGGSLQECNSTGGNTVELSAQVQLLNGAELASINWSVDGNHAGSGASISPFLQLGTHSVSVTATGISGVSDTESTSVVIRDTTKPDLSIDFIDTRSSQSVSSIDDSSVSFVEIRLSSNDTCDSDVTTGGVAKPVFAIMGSEVIKIQGNNNTVEMPTTAIEVSASAVDDSGNKKIDTGVLPIN